MLNPYIFKGTLNFELKNPGTTSTFLAKKLFAHFSSINPEKASINSNNINIVTFSNLFSLEHSVEIDVFFDEIPRIEYKINFGEVYKIILMVLLFALFFIQFSWWIYAIIGLFFSAATVSANVHFVNSFIKRNIFAVMSNYAFIGDDYISKQQSEWIKNPHKCSACGEEINEYNDKCLNCGLKVGVKRKIEKSNSTLENVSFRYSIKKNEKNRR